MTNFRDLFARISPVWLRRYWGARFMGEFADGAQEIADLGVAALRTARINGGTMPEDALGQIGIERRIPRYPGEDANEYEARLFGAWEAYRRAGTAFAVISQLEGFGLARNTVNWTGLTPFNPLPSNSLHDFLATAVTLSTSPTALAPDGTAALVLRETSANSSHKLAAAGLLATGQAAMATVDVKADGRTWCRVSAADVNATVSYGAWFDLATGSLGSVDAATQAEVERLGDGWYRLRLGFQTLTAPRFTASVFSCNANGASSFAGDPAKGLLLRDSSMRMGSWPVTIYTAREWDRGPYLHPKTNDPWWSRFWVFIDYRTHQDALTAEQKLGLVEIVRKWKSSRWNCDGIILGGSGPTAGVAAFASSTLFAVSTEPEILTI